MYNFLYPYWFLLLLLIPLLIWWDIFSFRKLTPKIQFSNLALLKTIQKRNSLFKYLPITLKSILIALIAIALARPRFTQEIEERIDKTHGVDIVLSIDVSGSMQAVDFRPKDRMEAAKDVALNFISKRRNDRIGIVTFSTTATTLTPLTNNFSVLSTVVSGIKVDPPPAMTAIGNGIASAVSRLKDSPAESKVIILLTDGVNNAGQIAPLEAAEIARLFGIKIYCVGIGTKGLVDMPVGKDRFTGRTIYQKQYIEYDEEALHQIAHIGGTGRARTASNTEHLQQIFDEIDLLEKTEIESEVYYEYRHKEYFIYFLYFVVGILLVMILARSMLRLTLP